MNKAEQATLLTKYEKEQLAVWDEIRNHVRGYLSSFSKKEKTELGNNARKNLKAIKSDSGSPVKKIKCFDGIIRTPDEFDDEMAISFMTGYFLRETEH